MDLQNLTMMLPSHLGWPLSLKTPNIGNTGLSQKGASPLFKRPLLQNTAFRWFIGIGITGSWIVFFVVIAIASSETSSDPNLAPDPSTLSAEDQEKLARWQEHYDHHGTVNAFTEFAHEITADTIVDPQELTRICFTYSQWQGKMSIVKEWLEDYREFDPEQAKDPSITNLEVKVDGILELLATSLESCEEMREDG